MVESYMHPKGGRYEEIKPVTFIELVHERDWSE